MENIAHLNPLSLIGCGVHLGNDDLIVLGVGLAKFVPDGSQFLAVAYGKIKTKRIFSKVVFLNLSRKK